MIVAVVVRAAAPVTVTDDDVSVVNPDPKKLTLDACGVDADPAIAVPPLIVTASPPALMVAVWLKRMF